MISDKIQLRPRYNEVDQMGYVYHANYVTYCHQARTELLRKYGINDRVLEENNIMLPVINFNIQYKYPVYYDELLTIQTTIYKMPLVRFEFEFEMTNETGKLVCRADSTTVFVDRVSRYPGTAPEWVENKLQNYFKQTTE
ncbi:MAG: YbgC/FadM family acyl-CoA thioesterase [Bacteroidetes bacterium]|jgi:acyl-CoA thioester hydrolase|nr:YbgC/FadM family acyl-CoA thioesterase [Bacteroidota bacterium]